MTSPWFIVVSIVPTTRAVRKAFFGVPSPNAICENDGADATAVSIDMAGMVIGARRNWLMGYVNVIGPNPSHGVHWMLS
jgi:hypothetical protein